MKHRYQSDKEWRIAKAVLFISLIIALVVGFTCCGSIDHLLFHNDIAGGLALFAVTFLIARRSLWFVIKMYFISKLIK